MYVSVISLKNGKTIPFRSVVPFSADKVQEDGWNLITDEENGQIISIRGSEIASICSQDIKNIPKEPVKPQDHKKKSKSFTTKVTTE